MATPTPQPAAYEPEAVEQKWQARWQERRTNSLDLASATRPFYNLMMFPYPSAEGLHVGNVFAFVGTDISGRYHRLRGHDVFEPIGFDAFGIHSENYALKVNTHPAELIPRNIARFRTQLRRMGLMVNWDHEVATTDPAYYKWTQWIFLELFKAGLAYRKAAPVNWCPECKTVLANEQVIDGYCERHPDTLVTQRVLEQWFFAITRFAPRLLDHLETMDWSDSTRMAQRNWIGRSEGAELVFETTTGEPIMVFTTRPDTVFGATWVVLAPEHPLVERITTPDRRADVEAYIQQTRQMDIVSRRVGTKEKTGVFTGAHARNPATGAPVPIWIADYVLMEYGTGAIMAVPGHDDRDFEFAQKFELPIVRVVEPAGDEDGIHRPAYRGGEPETKTGRSRTSRGKVDWCSRVRSTGCRVGRRSPPSRSGSKRRGARGRRCSIVCTTGAFPGSGIGGRRSPSSIATRAARSPFRRRIFPCCFRRSRTTARTRAVSRRLPGSSRGIAFPVRRAATPHGGRRTSRTRSSIRPGISCATRPRSLRTFRSIRR